MIGFYLLYLCIHPVGKGPVFVGFQNSKFNPEKATMTPESLNQAGERYEIQVSVSVTSIASLLLLILHS